MLNINNMELCDYSNAKFMAKLYRNRIYYIASLNKWIYWDSTHWRYDETGQIIRYAKTTVKIINRYLRRGFNHSFDEISDHLKKSYSLSGINRVIKLLESEPGIPIALKELDQHKYLSNCLNGTLDLKQGILLPYDRAHLITKIMPVNYDADTKCPTWIEFLEDVTDNNQEYIDYLKNTM